MAFKSIVSYFGSSASVSTEMDENNTWINRPSEGSFKVNSTYCGIVENLQSKHAATIVIAQKKNGQQLGWHEDWTSKKVEFGRVLLIVERLRRSPGGPEYKKDEIIYDILREGDGVMVEIKLSKQSPDNIFKYFAHSAYKVDCKKFDCVLEHIRDPLRGVVESVKTKDVGVIRFGTYDGRQAKALFTIEQLYFNGEKMKKHLPLASVASTGAHVYLELTRWGNSEPKQELEKMLYSDGVIFRSTFVWLKGDPRPFRGDTEKIQKVNPNQIDRSLMKNVTGANPRKKTGSSVGTPQSVNLTNRDAYYGRVESIISSFAAVVCIAHRNGEPLTWKDDWFASSVNLDRVLLLADHIRPSKTEPEYMKGTRIRQILKVAEPLRVVVDPSDKGSDKCYKWFARTSWKVNKEEAIIYMIPMQSLKGHLCGVVECLTAHGIGIVSFNTYFGSAAKAFFTHDSFYKDGKRIMKHVPLACEITSGVKVHLVVDKWNPGNNPSKSDQDFLQKNICFRAVMVWEDGKAKPDEEFHHEENKTDMQKTEFKKKDNVPYRGKGGSRGVRGRGRGGYRRGHRGRGSRNEGDTRSNCSDDSDCTSDISSLSDFSSSLNLKGEKDLINFSTTDYDSASRRPRRSGKSSSSSQQYSSPSTDSTTGTIVSVDDKWGLIQVTNEEVIEFRSNVVYLYGLKVDDVPLHKLFRQGQALNVHLKEQTVSLVEYGAPQLPAQMRQAVLTYCDMNSLPGNVREQLERIMERYGV